MKKFIYKITGIHCSSCAMMIENSLEDFDGISEAKCNYAKATCEIKTEDFIDGDVVKQIIEKEGYQAEQVAGNKN